MKRMMKRILIAILIAILITSTGCIAGTTTTAETGIAETTTTAATSILPDRIIIGGLADIDTIAGDNYSTLCFDDGLTVEVTTSSLINFSNEFSQFFESDETFTYDFQQNSQNPNLYDLIAATPGANNNGVNVR